MKNLKLPRYESLYVLFSPWDLPWRAKIGISQNHEIRKADVETSIRKNLDRRVKLRHYALPVLFARQNERIAHFIFKPLSYKGMVGTNGHTEWMWTPNVLCFAILSGFLWYKGVPDFHWKAFALLIFPWPLDHFLIVTALAVAQYATLIALVYAALKWLGLY